MHDPPLNGSGRASSIGWMASRLHVETVVVHQVLAIGEDRVGALRVFAPLEVLVVAENCDRAIPHGLR